MNKRHYFEGLESLRGLAALIVALHHITWNSYFHDLGIIKNGYLMVDFFFVLSGFVIFHSYSHKISSKKDLLGFMWLRLGRLYPLHIFMLFVFLGIETARFIAQTEFGMASDIPGFSINNERSFLLNVLMIQSLGVVENFTFNSPSWSISVEFYTYLAFALTTLLLKGSSRAMMYASLLIVSSCFYFLIVTVGKNSLHFNLDYGFFRCLLSFFIGILTYQLCSSSNQNRPEGTGSRLKSYLSVLVISLIAVYLSVKAIDLTDFAAPILASILIWSMTTSHKPLVNTVLQLKPMIWLGKTSYSIYMVHYAVLWWFSILLKSIYKENVSSITPFEGLMFSLAALAVIFFISHFTFKIIEEPFRKKSRTILTAWQAPSN